VSSLLLLLLWSQLSVAGDQLSTERLVQQADAVVVVAVCFQNPAPVVRIEAVLLGDEADLQDRAEESELLGLCLPSAELLRTWLARDHQPAPARLQWQRALDAGGYRAVLALRSVDGLSPICETETLLAEHWLSHPAHSAWRDQVDAAIAARSGESYSP
jgi:hypothetical protein